MERPEEEITYVSEALRMRGMPHDVVAWEDTGGGCMCIIVRFLDGSELAFGNDHEDGPTVWGASYMDADGGSDGLGYAPFRPLVHEALTYATEQGIPRGVDLR